MPDQVIEFDPTRCAEQLRNEIMNFIKTEVRDPWQKSDQFDQQRIINRVERMASENAWAIAKAVLHADSLSAPATIKSITGDAKNLTAKVVFHSEVGDDEKLGIIDRIGGSITVVLRDPNQYSTIRTKLTAEPDQPELPIQPGAKGPDPVAIAEHLRQEDAADAHQAVEDETAVVAAQAGGDLLEEEDPEAAEGDALGAKLVNIPNPTAKPAAPAEADEI